MIALTSFDVDISRCESEVREFADFLNRHKEIQETRGRSAKLGDPPNMKDFFDVRPMLLWLMGGMFNAYLIPHSYRIEASIFHEFRADYLVADESRKQFLFVEFEDATESSIFKKKGSADSPSYEWSERLEKGFSQVIDWHFRIFDYGRTSKIIEHFGNRIEYTGVLVIGRDTYVDGFGLRERFDWRVEKTVVDSKKILCLTFDELLTEMQGRLAVIKAMLAGSVY